MEEYALRRTAGRFLILFLLLFCGSNLFSQTKVSGRVADLNGKGVEGVVVSDGFNVCKSDSRGNFFFETSSRAKFVFISTPSGYEQVGDFYLRLGANAPGSFDFRLKKAVNQPSTFIHIGDPEASTYKDWIDGLKDYISNHKIAFLLLNGDICYEKGQDFHAREITSKTMGTRVVYTVGNHDLIAGDYGEQHFEQHFGPVWYSFNVGGVHFVVTPVLYGDKVPGYSADDLYNWLKKDLGAMPAGTPVIFANHHFYGYSDDFVFKTDNQVLDMCSYNLKGYLYAHYHTNLFKLTGKGVATYSSMSPNKGGIDHSPSSFRVLNFDRQGNMVSQLKYSCLDNHVVANGFHGRQQVFRVISNIYDTGSEAEKVSLLAGKKEYALEQKSSWSWECSVAGDIIDKVSADRLKVKIIFSDGSLVYKQLITENDSCSAVGGPSIKWSANLGANIYMASPLISDGLVICATIDDDMALKSSIQAVDKESGDIRWKFTTRNSVKGNMSLWDGKVLACDVEGRVYALDAVSGKLLWLRDIRTNNIHPVFTEGVTVWNGIVYAGQGTSLTAIRISDGEIIWVNKGWKNGVSTVANPVVDSKSGILLSGGYWSGRFACDAATGSLKWEKRDEDSRICDNSPVVYDGHFFYTSPEYITEVDPVSGRELLKVKIDQTVNVLSRPVVTDKYYIVGTSDKGIVAFDRQNGYKELWNYKINPSLIYTAPYTKDFQMTVESGACLIGYNLYFGGNDGFVYCLDVRNGLFKWRVNLGAPILGNIVVENGNLFVNDFGGNVWCFKLPQEQVK